METETLRRIYIKSEADLPKPGLTYYEAYTKRGNGLVIPCTNSKWWVKNIAYYFQPVDPDKERERIMGVLKKHCSKDENTMKFINLIADEIMKGEK